MNQKRIEKIELLNQKMEVAISNKKTAMQEELWEKAAEYNNEIKELKFRLSVMSQTSSRLEEIALEIGLHIESWLNCYNKELDDKGAKGVQLDYYNDLIEELLLSYVVEKGYNDQVFGVPLSLCLKAPLGVINFNGATYGSSHNIRVWLKHVAGVELSEEVSTSYDDKELKALALKYWDNCLSKMSEFE